MNEKKPEKIRFQVFIEKELIEQLREIAKKEFVSVGSLIKKAIIKFYNLKIES